MKLAGTFRAAASLLCLAFAFTFFAPFVASAEKVDDWSLNQNRPEPLPQRPVVPRQQPIKSSTRGSDVDDDTSHLSDFELFSQYIQDNFIVFIFILLFFLFATLAGLFMIRKNASQVKIPLFQDLSPCKKFNNNKDHFSAAKVKKVLYTSCVCLTGLIIFLTFCYFTAKPSHSSTQMAAPIQKISSPVFAHSLKTNSVGAWQAPLPQLQQMNEMNMLAAPVVDAAAVRPLAARSRANVHYNKAPRPPADRTIGLSVGGAKDINNFRENIEQGFLPQKTDITIEGIFYDYFFDTGLQNDAQKGRNNCQFLFCPSYTQAISPKPQMIGLSSKDLDGEDEEYFLSIGLNSNVKESDFGRNKLNLVVVLDISGSMSSPFNRYYYDGKTGTQKESEDFGNKNKLDVAKEALVGLLDNLGDEDRLGLVLFESRSYLVKPLNYLKHSDIDVLKQHIKQDVHTIGGTNFEAGYRLASDMLEKMGSNRTSKEDEETVQYDNRIIFITDAMPNTDRIGKDDLLGLTKNNAENEENRIYTSFIGVGVDFNTKLIDYITKIRGANYYSVHNSKEFLKRMDQEFEFMVTPLVFDLKLLLDSDTLQIDEVYGSNSAGNQNETQKKHEIMSVTSLFPSAKSEDTGETKGGIILAKLVTKGDTNGKLDELREYRAKLSVSYENSKGVKSSNEQTIDFASVLDEMKEGTSGVFENSGIRKGILLTRYVDLLHDWIDDSNGVHVNINRDEKVDDWNYKSNNKVQMRSEWERGSTGLSVSDKYRSKFQDFVEYFRKEMKQIGDDTLEQEIKIMEKLIDHGSKNLRRSSLE